MSGQENAQCVTPLPKVSVTLTEFQLAEKEVLKFIQREHFYEEIRVLMKLKVVGEEVSIRELAKFVYLFIYLFIYLRICTSSTGAKTLGHKSPTRFKHQQNREIRLSRCPVVCTVWIPS